MSRTHDTQQVPPRLPAAPGESQANAMAAAWRRGECLPAEHYLASHPELLDPPEGAVRLIYEELCLRLERGEPVAPEELYRRFPQWASELGVMLDCHRLVQARLAPPAFPEVGETLGDFHLLAELGRGLHGRVFLAAQPTLADRLVVLKVTPRRDREFLSLARLQHTHIIPLHGAYDFPARNLRALCQPYLGGATLSRLLELLQGIPVARRTGQALVAALDQESAHSSHAPPGLRGPREALARASYAEAVCWIGACLADALHYAQERGLLHLDVKPSNVLLAADGQPLLLDFHLALHPIASGQAAPEGLGGTLAYMSPEQRAAYLAGRAGLPIADAIDGRSDIYSLGRMLYLALGGEPPVNGQAPRRLHRCNPRVSPGLSDIVHHCLAADPADRYPDAAGLSSDLRRHLNHQPLHGVRNRSLRERWGKWRRRRPHSLLWVGLLLALTAVPVVVGAVVVERLREAREALREGQEQMDRRAYTEAVRTLDRGQTRIEGLPGCGGLRGDLERWHQCARRASAAQRLHTVCERLRLMTGADVLPARDLRTLAGHCQTVWEARGLITQHDDAELDEATEEQIRVDLIDLALLWIDLKSRLRTGTESDRSALRAELPEKNGKDGEFRTHAWRGRALLRAGQLEQAATELERASEMRPQEFWVHFDRGACAYRRGRPEEAVHSFSVAIALMPEFAEVYCNRALAREACGHSALALQDYDRALMLAPTLATASLNRGVLHYRGSRYAQARADLERALRQGSDPIATHFNLALVHEALRDRPMARTHLEKVLGYNPGHPDARGLLEQMR